MYIATSFLSLFYVFFFNQHYFLYLYYIIIIFHIFYIISSLLPLQSVGRSNFDKGLHSLITLIKKNDIK